MAWSYMAVVPLLVVLGFTMISFQYLLKIFWDAGRRAFRDFVRLINLIRVTPILSWRTRIFEFLLPTLFHGIIIIAFIVMAGWWAVLAIFTFFYCYFLAFAIIGLWPEFKTELHFLIDGARPNILRIR